MNWYLENFERKITKNRGGIIRPYLDHGGSDRSWRPKNEQNLEILGTLLTGEKKSARQN